MFAFLDASFQQTLLLLGAIVFCTYLFLKLVVYSYWSRKGVVHDQPWIPLGNVPLSYFQGKLTHGEIIKQSYEKNKSQSYHGIYLLYEPILVINDLDLIRAILVKNFANFYDRGTYNNETHDPLSSALPRLTGDKWKRLRGKLSPTFTSGKIKSMLPLLREICDELVDVFSEQVERMDGVIEIKELSSRFTIDCISSIAFGFNCNSLRNPDHEFRKYGKISNDFGKIFVLLSFYVPDFLHLYPVPEKRRRVEKFFIDLFATMVEHRKRSEKVERNDFLSMLMQLMELGQVQEDGDLEKTTTSDKLTLMEAVAQSVIFFAAGQETTSSAISCCLHELALNPEIQEKLRLEVDDAFANSNDGLAYEKINEMKYLDMVLCETLRKHPGAPVLNRICIEDFVIPESNLRIEKGTRLAISVNGIHMDPNFYPEPDEFDPMRFASEAKAQRHAFAYLPFGEGPRHCIGKRLGILKPKIALCYLLRNYEFSKCDKTQEKLSYMNNFFVQVPQGGVFLKVSRRNVN